MIIPYTLWEAIVVGLRGSIAYGFYAYIGTILALVTYYGILCLTPRRKLRKALDQAEGLKDVVNSLKARLWDLEQEVRRQEDELAWRRRLMLEEANHNKAWGVRVRVEERARQ